MPSASRGPIAVGQHARIELVSEDDAPEGDAGELVRITVDVPFELASMAEAQLDISEKLLRLQGPLPEDGEVRVPLPPGFALDPDRTAAKYSKKRRQLTITSPNGESPYMAAPASLISSPASAAVTASAPKASCDGARGRPVAEACPPDRRSPDEHPPDAALGIGGARAAPHAAATLDEVGQDDDDDDDLPPMLDAARSAPRGAPHDAQGSGLSTAVASGAGEVLTEQNSASEALMRQALEARERKRLEGEESRRQADLGPALKKGFLSNSKGKAKKKPAPEVEEVPYIAGSADPEAARRESLKLPEVQAALRGATTKLKEDQSWVTPTLIQAMNTRPDLMKGMSDPRIQEAMQLMQTDPEQAKMKYKDDKEVTKFLKEFSGMMATHFDVLGKDSGAGSSSAPKDSQKDSQKEGPVQLVGKKLPKGLGAKDLPTPVPIEDPKVAEALQDPEVQVMLRQMQSGRSPEFHDLCRQNPRLFARIKVLLDAGLLNMQH